MREKVVWRWFIWLWSKSRLTLTLVLADPASNFLAPKHPVLLHKDR